MTIIARSQDILAVPFSSAFRFWVFFCMVFGAPIHCLELTSQPTNTIFFNPCLKNGGS